jgi:hypothetical protein
VDSIREQAPQATLVFDKFHIVRHLLDAVNDVRKAEARALQASHPELLRGTRYTWLKNPENLTDRQRLRLAELEKRGGLKVLRAYELKELFRKLWDYRSKTWAKRYLDRWFWWATHSGLEPLREFAWMLRDHEDGVLAYFDHRIDNGAVEAMNNNAKAISHRARGFRSEKAFTLAMLHCLGGLEFPEASPSRNPLGCTNSREVPKFDPCPDQRRCREGREPVRLRLVLAFLRIASHAACSACSFGRAWMTGSWRSPCSAISCGCSSGEGSGPATARLTGPSSSLQAGSSRMSGGRPSESSPVHSSAGAASLTPQREGGRAGGRGVLRSIPSCAN